MKTLVMRRKITFSILMVTVLVCSFQGVNPVAEAVTVPEDPALSDLFAAEGDESQALLKRATRLCEGLEFPRDTFAVNDKLTVLVGHTSDGSGLVIQGNFRSEAGGGINLGWITLVPRGNVRVLTRYAPSGESILCGLDESPPQPTRQPDLSVQSFRSDKSTLSPGESFTLSATVQNSGDGQASSTTLRYYRSTDATISSNDTEVGTDRVSVLGANRTGDESISLTAPTSPGTYYYGVCVDSVTDESDTDNNCSTAVSVTVTAPPNDRQPGGTTYSVGEEILTLPTGFWTLDLISRGSFSIIGGKVTIELSNGGRMGEEGITYTCIASGGCTIEDRRVTRGTIQALPDSGSLTSGLVVEAAQAVPATVAPGRKFTLSTTLRNQGTVKSAAAVVRYYRSPDNTIATNDTQIGIQLASALSANATIRQQRTVTAPTTPGTYYYGVCVDSVTNESNTANNCSIAVSVTVTALTVVVEDVNADGVVDVQDLVVVAQRYGQTGTNRADVNGDGVVNIDDLILVAAVIDGDAAAPSLYADTLEGLTVADVKVWLSQARQRDVMDPSVRRGIQFLEQHLAAMVPRETALLANYPNPFNPETWIPYQLAKSADVTLTIYGIDGHIIRQLALGHQPAGVYQSRSRAAYWDGKNAFGEPVASGVYFYTLTAGDFTATRKMLIRK